MALKIILAVFLLIELIAAAEFECGKSQSALERYQTQMENETATTDPFEANGHDWPWMAHYWRCSSTIISPKWVLTAAHCKELPVAGIIYGSDDRTYGKPAEIQAKFPHPKHERGFPGYDIMLVELEEPLIFNENVSSICIRRNPFPTDPGTKAILTGWGKLFKGLQYWVKTDDSHKITNDDIKFEFTAILHDKFVHFRDRDFCANITDDMICAGGIGEGSTPEDSGGAMMAIVDGKFYQQGIIGGGEMYTVAGRDDVYEDHGFYTDISQYCDWIKETTRGEVECEN